MSDTDLLKEIRERYDAAEEVWQPIRDEAKKDMLCVSGDPWEALDSKGKAQRKATSRPCIALDELGQYSNQVINDVRANPRAVKFDPTGNGANDESANFYRDKMREIEYRSKAHATAYVPALENGVNRSYGWVRVNTKFQPKSFNQEIWIEGFPNPDMVTPDPEALKPTSADMRFCFVREKWRKSEFERRFPKAKTNANFGDYMKLAPSWVMDDGIMLAEYWAVETKMRKLVLLRAPTGAIWEGYEDEIGKMPAGYVAVRTRQEEVPYVCQYLTNGVEIFPQMQADGSEGNKIAWPGKYIPIVSCFGKVIYVDEGGGAKRKILSMVRLARDPYMLYSYIRTCEAEAIGGVPRATRIGYKGQFDGLKADHIKANHEPVAYLEVNATTDATGAAILPLPVRESWDPPLQNLEIAAESARRAIQAAMGISPLPTEAQKRNEKSGKALDRIEASSQKGSFHFVDHYEGMIDHVGVICEDLIDKIYDTQRQVGIRKPDDTTETITINDPTAQQPVSTKGDHLVTVSTGPSFDNERAVAEEYSDTLLQNLETIAAICGPKSAAALMAQSIKLKALGPIGDQMYDYIMPPDLKGDNGKPKPAEVAQLEAQIQQMQQQLQQAAQELAIEKSKYDAMLQKAQLDSDTKKFIADLEARVDKRAQDIDLMIAAMRQQVDQMKIAHQAATQVAGAHASEREGEQGRQHERQLTESGREHEAQLAERGHQAAREQAEVKATKPNGAGA